MMKISLAFFVMSPAVNAFMVQPPSAFSRVVPEATHTSIASSVAFDTVYNGAPPTFSEVAPPTAMQSFIRPKNIEEIFDELAPVTIQGGTLRTCSFNESVERVTVYLKTEGRPLNANVELWQGPDNSPQRMSVYLEDGSIRPFICTIESPGTSNAVSVRNTGQMEYPLTVGLDIDMTKEEQGPSGALLKKSGRTVQGGAVYTTPFPPAVQSVQMSLRTEGRPLKARVELLQGPNNNKQVMEIYTEDGRMRPFSVIIETPGAGSVVRIVNTATLEFPLVASIEPYFVDESFAQEESTNGNLVWS